MRHRPDFDEPETEGRHLGGDRAVFVEPGGESRRVRKLEAETFERPERLTPEAIRGGAPERPRAQPDGERVQRYLVRRLRR